VDERAAAFTRLFLAVHEGVYIGTIGPDATHTIAANPHLKVVLGYGSDVPDAEVRIFEPDRFFDAQSRVTLLERLINDGSVVNYLIRLRRCDQVPVWVELTARAEPAARGLRVEALVRDVSERKKIDDETRDIYHQILQAEKMAVLGQTVSGVAHELNNPLATILTWAERLSQRPSLEPAVRRGLEIILSESERAARIVRNLLTFARKRQTTRALLDINQVVHETLALRAYEQRVTNITVIEALAAGLPQAFADAHQVQQVLLNLIINAEQAMLTANGRGVLVMRSWHDPEQDCVVVEVNDDGPGIPQEVQDKIFDPFFTTKEVGKGTGLGLTVAYAIVNEHGGRIRVESGASSGVSFFVDLPVSGSRLPPPPAPRSAAVVENSAPSRHASVLVVDDEAALAAAVGAALVDAGYAVEQASDGEQALVRLQSRTFDLVICDLRMPRMDGKTFYRMLTGLEPALAKRVIFVTGDLARTDAEKFLLDTGCRWLSKPFRLADLVRTAREVLES
jgi:signal transduction histidine kinase